MMTSMMPVGGMRLKFFWKSVALAIVFGVLLLWGTPRAIAQGRCGQEMVCHEALVKFSRLLSGSDIQDILRRHDAVIVQRFPHLRLYHLHFTNDAATTQQVESLAQEIGVLKASPNWIVRAQALPNDPSFGLLWGLDNTGQTIVGNPGVAGADIGTEPFWDSYTDGSAILVAVIDTGVNYDHVDLAANIWTNPGEVAGNGLDDDNNGFVDDIHGYDFRNGDGDPMDDHGHGTHVSGTIGAVGNNGIGVAGVNWKAKIMAVKFLGSGASGNLSDAVAGIDYAVANGAMVLNNSWGGGGFDGGLFSAILDSDAVGTIFVAAAGNNSADIDQSAFYPASYDSPNLISVASIHNADGLSSFSNYGKVGVDLGAPGSNVYSTTRNGSYGYMSGTSMATPHVVGAAALLWAQFPALSHRQIIQILLHSVVDKSYLENNTVTGGLLNLTNALAIAEDPTNVAPVANAGSDQTVAVGDTATLQGSASDGDSDFPLFFEWELTTPPGSQSALDDPLAQQPSFIPDAEGTFTATLVVSDFISSSIADSAVITVDGVNIPPPTVVIKAQGIDPETGRSVALGSGIPTEVGRSVSLDGSESVAAFSYLMVFEWSLVEKPLDSIVALGNPQDPMISLTPEVEGSYTVRLTVEDGFFESFADFSFVAASPQEPPAPAAPPPGTTGPQATSAGGCSLQKF